MLTPGLVFKGFLHIRDNFPTESRLGVRETQVESAADFGQAVVSVRG